MFLSPPPRLTKKIGFVPGFSMLRGFSPRRTRRARSEEVNDRGLRGWARINAFSDPRYPRNPRSRILCVVVCSKHHQNVLLPLVVLAWRRAQRGVMRARRLAHDRLWPGPYRPSQSMVQASLVPFRPNSRLSHRDDANILPYARICKAGMLA